MMQTSMLVADDLNLHFGGLVAADHVSFNLEEGKITGLIGPNGAGKTTLFNIISGVYAPESGTILFRGRHIEGMRPHQINQMGISRTYQVINLFRKMTVLENVLVGMHPKMKSGYFSSIFHTSAQRKEEMMAYERAFEWLKFVGLESRASESAGALSYGDQRKLEIVRGMASEPQLLLLDEPAAGMNTGEKEELDELLHRIIDNGITILIIEHDMKLMMGVADYIIVLNYGAKLAEGIPQEIQNNPEVIRAYLGGDE